MNDPVQQQLIAARRNQILDAAARVFAAKGFHPATTKDIAREADISEGTIYNYFENKPALLFGILDRMKMAALQDADLSTLNATDFRQFMQAYFRHPLMALKADNFELFRVIMSEIMVNEQLRTLYHHEIIEPTLKLAETAFHEWTELRMIRPLDIRLTMRAVSGMIMGLIFQYTMGDPLLEEKWDQLPDFLADLFIEGIGNR